jgi:DNA end-binding protein Ku
MAARAVASTTISFGLVAIPTKLYTAASSEQVRFNMLEKSTGARLKQQYVSAADGSVVERSDTVKGYEYSRGQYVTFTEEELKGLESTRGQHIEIVEFVPLETLDYVYVEKSYYLGPDKGGDRAYQLLTECMRETRRVAVGQWAARGKEQLVVLRPYGKCGLILHQLYYANEVRRFDEIDPGATHSFSDSERKLGRKLIEQLGSAAFDPGKYRDEYAVRVAAAVDQKVRGQEVTTAVEQPRGQIIDLFEALKKSLGQTGGQRASNEGLPMSPRSNDEAVGVEPRPLKKASPKRSRKRAANT